MKLTRLRINKFRHLKNINLTFGGCVTAIAGQNGTGKSSVLGLVGHVFTFPAEYKNLNEKPFATQYSEIFRFSYPYFDRPKDHDYSVELDNGESVSVLSYDRKERGGSKSLRVRVGKSKSKSKKIVLPVIYLGLRRLFPLAQERKVSHQVRLLESEQVQEYQDLHNEILLLDERITPEYVDTFSKSFYAIKTDNYDCWGNSAGQDNVGQILTAILSFKKLRNEIGEKYKGGILLIDELDATLYPAAQIKLVEKLFRFAQDLSIQIIFTTHSTDVVAKILDPRYRYDSKVIYLTNDTGKVKNVQDEISIDSIINNLKVQLPVRAATDKILVFCEDKEARLWIANLLGTKIMKNIKFVVDSFGANNLVQIANKKIPVFRESIFVLDGDKNSALKNNRCPRVILLPGGERPENIFYHFLKKLPMDDKFWGNSGGYTKQFCFKDQSSSSDNRDVMKRWFSCQIPYWGRGGSKLFSRWKEDNLSLANEFKNEFEKIIKLLTN